MLKFIAAIIVAVLLPMTFSSPAEATRPVPGHNYPDVCKNIAGKQTVLQVLARQYRFVGKSGRCVRVRYR